MAQGKSIAGWAAALLATAVATAALVPTYHISSKSSARLACNPRECFVFVSETHLGWMGNYVVDAGRILKGLFYATSRPTHRYTSPRGRLGETHAAAFQTDLFFHITPKETHRHWGPDVGMIGFFGEEMYVWGTGTWWKWNGTQFETVDTAERQQFGAGRDLHVALRISDYHGWSLQAIGVEGEARRDFPIILAGESITISVLRSPGEEKRIVVDRGNGNAQTIWSLEEGPRQVDRATYSKTLGLSWW